MITVLQEEFIQIQAAGGLALQQNQRESNNLLQGIDVVKVTIVVRRSHKDRVGVKAAEGTQGRCIRWRAGKGDVYLAGIGLSIGDSLLYGMTAISYITWCTAIQAGQAQDMLAQLAAEEVTTTYETVSALFTTPSVLWLLLGVNCILDMVLNIALMNVIFGVIKGNLAKWWYGVTAAVTFFAMISFQLYNQESVASIAVSFAVKLVIFAVTIYYTFRVAGKEIEYSDD